MVTNEEMEDIMKIVKSLKESILLIKRIGERIKNEAKEQFFSILIRTLACSIFANALRGQEVVRQVEQ